MFQKMSNGFPISNVGRITNREKLSSQFRAQQGLHEQQPYCLHEQQPYIYIYIYNDEAKFRKQIVSFHKNLYKESVDWRQQVSYKKTKDFYIFLLFNGRENSLDQFSFQKFLKNKRGLVQLQILTKIEAELVLQVRLGTISKCLLPKQCAIGLTLRISLYKNQGVRLPSNHLHCC